MSVVSLLSRSRCASVVWVRSPAVTAVRLRHDERFVYPHRDSKKDSRKFKKFTLRLPFKHGFNNNVGVTVEGVSDKQYPVMLQWERPAQIPRTTQGFEGSGDMEGLPALDENR